MTFGQETMYTENLVPCPSCGFLVFSGGYGSYDICELCNWEDCGVQLANPLDDGGPNRESLASYQSASISRWPSGVTQVDRYQRDPHWRPLTSDEIEYYANATNNGGNIVFKAVWTSDKTYWNQTEQAEQVGDGDAEEAV